MTARAAFRQAEVADTTPLRLADAAERAFPGGGMTVSGLRREAARGRLAIMRIAGKDWVTIAAIKEMMELCRVPPKEPACGFAPRGETPPALFSKTPDGSSATADGKLALDAALAIARRLKDGSPAISPPNTPRNGGSVHFLKSGSPT